jgi:hypothetical protein
MNNQVYKCERCGKLYTEAEWEKSYEEIRYRLSRKDPSCSRDSSMVGLCGECSIALNGFMDRGQTKTAPTPEKKEEAPGYNELIFKALAEKLIEHAMRMNGEES